MSVQFSNFKSIIKEFLKLDEEIRSLSKARLERSKKRDTLSKEITQYYQKNNISCLNLNDMEKKQQLELVESSRHPSVNQKFLRETLVKYCNDDKIVNNMIDYILQEREKNSKPTYKLKRIIPKSSKKNTAQNIDPGNLLSDADKIKQRFAKLADFAIIKDGINIETDSQKQNDIIIDNIIINQHKQQDIEESRSLDEEKYVDEEDVEEEDIDEEDVDLDEIPEEDTGYTEEPPQIEEDLKKDKTIKNIISQRIDQMDQKQFVGAIPTPTPKPVNNSKHLEYWKTLEEIAYRHNVESLKKWLNLQNKKLDIYKKKAQINSQDFILIIKEIKNQEDYINKNSGSNLQINMMKQEILKYIETLHK